MFVSQHFRRRMAGAAGGGGGDIINLNVGGTKFSTSKQTLTAIPVSIKYT